MGPDLPEDVDLPARQRASGPRAGDDPVALAIRTKETVVGKAAGTVVGSGTVLRGVAAVPERREGMDTSVLPSSYQRMLQVLAASDQPRRARELCAKLNGGDIEAKHVEGVRSKLKRLVKRGWAAETSQGGFALAKTVRR
ncbi:hypothetical protein [Streptomyces sp. H27-D2]|uniref:hypothetical protein n=1 Tax=Streptomyces sp. H27-D2 TaxID=3046304 RepID=UPI002DBB8C76|nr:hypothetical protein [Streptomyces sp. H27-D2]MEC4019295.1 hypothetical protein [Streptomyces sp. H27-D2]